MSTCKTSARFNDKNKMNTKLFRVFAEYGDKLEYIIEAENSLDAASKLYEKAEKVLKEHDFKIMSITLLPWKQVENN